MKLFVYGTLKRGFLGHDFFVPFIKNEQMEFISNSYVSGYELRLGLAPFLVHGSFQDDCPIIYGELYEINDEKIIEELDRGELWAYDRKLVKVDKGDEIYAYVARPSEFLDNSFDIGKEYTIEHDRFIKFMFKKLLGVLCQTNG